MTCSASVTTFTISATISRLSPARFFRLMTSRAIEVYYNFAVTPWFHLTADVQWIAPANATAENAWVGGLRANVTF